MSAINGKTASEGRNEEGSQANPRKNNDKFKASAVGHYYARQYDLNANSQNETLTHDRVYVSTTPSWIWS